MKGSLPPAALQDFAPVRFQWFNKWKLERSRRKMGSVTFDSQDGSSRVHDHVVTDIRCLKNLSANAEDVILSLGEGFLEDHTWIAGEDRAYFANQLRSVLAAEPEGEWSFRGLNSFDTPEALEFAAHCAARGNRVPGIHSIIEHLEASAEFPVVITNSVTASFPSLDFVPSFLERVDSEQDDDDYEYEELAKFEAMSSAEKWAMIWPTFLEKHGDKRWSTGPTKVAADLRSKLKGVGFWRDQRDQNDMEDRLIEAASFSDLLEGLRPELVSFGQSVIDEFAPEGMLYFLGEEPTMRIFGEPLARRNEDRLAGVGLVDMRIVPRRHEEIGRLDTYHMNAYSEPALAEQYTAVVCVPVLASADVSIDLVSLLLPNRGSNRLLILCAIANSQQAEIAADALRASGDVTIRAMETVDFVITGTWRHVNELIREDGPGAATSKWMFDRQIAHHKSASGGR
jgi:hypothetical protein